MAATSDYPKPALKTPQVKLKARREYYERNVVQERVRARDRARERRKNETPEEADVRKSLHRIAAARYRAANRTQLRINAWERRLKIKAQKEREDDEEEYQRFLAMEEDPDDEPAIRAAIREA